MKGWHAQTNGMGVASGALSRRKAGCPDRSSEMRAQPALHGSAASAQPNWSLPAGVDDEVIGDPKQPS